MATLQQFSVLIICFAFTWSRPCHQYTHSGFALKLDESGDYQIIVNGKTWLESADTFFSVAGQRYVANGTLHLVRLEEDKGEDNLGAWKSSTMVYEAEAEKTNFGATFKFYEDAPFVIFEQNFYSDVKGNPSGDRQSVQSGFPNFRTEAQNETLGFLAFGGIMFGQTRLRTGRWGNQIDQRLIASGLDSGPLVLFNKGSDVIIISPFRDFMAGSVQYDHNQKMASWGVLGSAQNVPADLQFATVLYYSDRGIQKALEEWGMMMRRYYRRSTEYRESDLTNNYLGYYTDNGAYYYYLTEPNMTYDQTLMAVKKSADSLTIPYRYIQYDSWWYYQGPHKGVTSWTSRDEIFPAGMRAVYDELGLPVVAHNRWWSDKTIYAKQNGGNFSFVIEADSKKALPTDQGFWDYLMRESRKWGLAVYEQDWLNKQFDEMDVTVQDLRIGRQWLRQMAAGAEKAGITLQYCMAPPRAALQTLEIPIVSQARASEDYQPGNDNWKIGITSMFAHGLGVAPFKDNFWTITEQPGNKYGRSEPHTMLNSIVSTLSTGPVAPADKIGYSNVSLIMRSCNRDGLLLKPSRPAFAVNAQIKQAAFRDGSGPDGEVWTTYSEVSHLRFGIILAAAMPTSSTYKLTPTEAFYNESMPDGMKVLAYNTSPVNPADFTDSHPITLQGCTRTEPCLYYTTPNIKLKGRDLYIYGELNKWVRMSGQRVKSIGQSEDDVTLDLVGGAGEVVNMTFVYDGQLNTYSCTLSPTGVARMHIINNVACVHTSGDDHVLTFRPEVRSGQRANGMSRRQVL